MLTAYNPDATHPYSLKKDEGDNKTVFHLGLFDSLLRVHILNSIPAELKARYANADRATALKVDMADLPALFQFNLTVVRFGVRSWEKLHNANGTPSACELEDIHVPGIGLRKQLTDRSLICIGDFLAELSEKIMQINFPSEADEKN